MLNSDKRKRQKSQLKTNQQKQAWTHFERSDSDDFWAWYAIFCSSNDLMNDTHSRKQYSSSSGSSYFSRNDDSDDGDDYDSSSSTFGDSD